MINEDIKSLRYVLLDVLDEFVVDLLHLVLAQVTVVVSVRGFE